LCYIDLYVLSFPFDVVCNDLTSTPPRSIGFSSTDANANDFPRRRRGEQTLIRHRVSFIDLDVVHDSVITRAAVAEDRCDDVFLSLKPRTSGSDSRDRSGVAKEWNDDYLRNLTSPIAEVAQLTQRSISTERKSSDHLPGAGKSLEPGYLATAVCQTHPCESDLDPL